MKYRMLKEFFFSCMFMSILLFLVILSFLSILYKTKPFSGYDGHNKLHLVSAFHELCRTITT